MRPRPQCGHVRSAVALGSSAGAFDAEGGRDGVALAGERSCRAWSREARQLELKSPYDRTLTKRRGSTCCKEAAHELDGVETAPLHFAGAILAVAEDDRVAVEALEPAIGDGDAMHVAAEVLEHLLAGAVVLTVHDPPRALDTGAGRPDSWTEPSSHRGGRVRLREWRSARMLTGLLRPLSSTA
jgi:hypothetical protein